MKNTRDINAGEDSQQQMALPRECERRYYAHCKLDEDDYDTATFRQNTEVPDGNHWRIELNLERWRNAQDLATYLRWAASRVEALNASRHIARIRHREEGASDAE